MNERLKTGILVFLLITGLYLTQKAWIQFPEGSFEIFSQAQEVSALVDEVNLLEDIIVPERYLIHFGDGDFTLIYDDRRYEILDRAKESIKMLFTSQNIELSQLDYEEYSTLRKERFIEFQFPQAMNSYILAASMDVEDLNDIVDEVEEIQRIYFSLERNGLFLLINGDKYTLVEDETLNLDSIRDVVELMETRKGYIEYELFDGIYIPRNLNLTIGELSVSNMIHSLDEKERGRFAERFFSREIDYIREIVESNGSNIYEYDNNVLKLNSNGVIEYFQVIEDTHPKPNLYISLVNAVDFIKNRVQLEEDIYLSGVEEIESSNNEGYRLYFRYKTSYIPLLVGGDYRDYIQVDVFNNQVGNFYHLANKGQVISRRNDLNRRLISPRDIMENNEELFRDQEIKAIDISYYDPATLRFNNSLQLVWVFESSTSLYAFDAYGGNLVYER